jgi:hypothetical protein
VGVRAAALRVRERIARAHCCMGRKDGAGRWRLKSGGSGATRRWQGRQGRGVAHLPLYRTLVLNCLG